MNLKCYPVTETLQQQIELQLHVAATDLQVIMKMSVL